ncbi:MAG: hypothetical protein ISS63_06440 [Desulfobacteraceae bacterium]|nr:hypothetical protein [Desulfobacteraceae bacterium]
MLKTSTRKYTFFSLCASLLFLSFLCFSTTGAEEKTPPYSPEGSRETKKLAPNPDATALEEGIPDMDVKMLRTEEYVVKEGDWIAKILRQKGALSDHTLPQLLEVLRKLNASLQNMNMIRPGEKIVILVKVLPSEDGEKTLRPGKRSASPPLKRLKSEAYKVKRGDILSRVVMSRYDLSSKKFITEYIGLFKKCNPSVENPDHILYGKVIRLPLYPPQFEEDPDGSHALRDLDKSPRKVAISLPESIPLQVKTPPVETRVQVKARPKPEHDPAPVWSEQEVTLLVAEDLGSIISQMGEEWIQSGEHFIPLKSSGHINLKAESYPIIRLNKGMTVIVDLHGALSNKMAKVIESSWENYRVVCLSTKDDLRSALDKILRAFRYPKILRKGQPIKLGGDIPVSITGDWIVTPPKTTPGKSPEFIVINLLQARSHGTPSAIKDYLKPLGVEIIEYPLVEERRDDIERLPTLEKAEDPESLIRAVLNLTGQDFSTRLRIPAYESANNDFRFTIEADFYLKIRGKSHIIDLAGLDPEVIALLSDDGISVLSLTKEHEPLTMVAKTLKFLNVNFEPGPHSFLTSPGNITRNVELTLKGILFYAHNGDSVFVSPLNLPSEIGAFLSQRGYKVLVLS